MNYKVPFKELSYGDGSKVVQFLHANAHVPEVYRKFLEGIGHMDYSYFLPFQRPLWSESDPRELQHWRLLGEDIISHMDANKRKGIIGMGHSMGAIATWYAAVKRPDLFSKLILIDPVILPEHWVKILKYVPYWVQKSWVPFVKIAVNRRDQWPNTDALEAHLGSKKVYKRFDTEVWEDFKKHAVVKTEDGRLQLRYPKAWEARVYGSAPNLWPLIGDSPCPITIVRAEYSDVLTPEIWELIQERMPDSKFIEVPKSGHLVPFEKPIELGQIIRKVLG